VERIAFYGRTIGEYCHDDCPQLRGTLDGVPEHVRKAYPKIKNSICLFFGPLYKPEDNASGFKITSLVRRAKLCVELAAEVKED
jgi:hypothetical protein